MTPDQIRQMIREELINILGDYSHVPLDVIKSLERLGFFKLQSDLAAGLIYSLSNNLTALGGTGVVSLTANVPSVTTGGSKGVYVATSPGGSPTNFMQVSAGIVTSI